MHEVDNDLPQGRTKSARKGVFCWLFCYTKQHMDWSTRKRMGCFGIVGIVIAIILGYFVYVFFIKTTPTCFDAVQNQNERGVDCGGVCARVCTADAKTIVPIWSRVFNTAGDVHSVVAYVENQNTTAGVKKIDYEFRIYDSQNILAGEPITGSTFIGPNDKTAIYASPIKTGNRTPKNVFFKFTSQPDWITTDARYSTPQLTTANTELTDITTVPKLSADVVNNTLYDYKNIEVVAILFGSDGNALNASSTFIEELPQQKTHKIYFTWPKPFTASVARIEIIPRLNPFIQR